MSGYVQCANCSRVVALRRNGETLFIPPHLPPERPYKYNVPWLRFRCWSRKWVEIKETTDGSS